jgi:hypothetical protein
MTSVFSYTIGEGNEMLRKAILLTVPSLSLLAATGCAGLGGMSWLSLLYGAGSLGGVVNLAQFVAGLFGVTI